jgi:peptide/nickel transport system ATP-binding protein
MQKPVVQLEELEIQFGSTSVLRNFNLTLFPGEVVSVVGESGSGKSIGALMSMGLLDEKATLRAEKAVLLGRPLLTLKELDWQELRGKEVAMVFQDPMTALHPSMRIGAQLDEVLARHTALSKTSRYEKIIAALEEVEIPDPAESFKKYPHQMSGGQRQRVVIAMALLLDPKLIIADEPTTALDKEVERKVLTLLTHLVKQRGSALWLISHDLEVVAEHSDRVLVLFRGDTVEEGLAKEVFRAPQHPYTQGLLGCRPPKTGRPFPLPTLSDFLDPRENSQRVELTAPSTEQSVLIIEGLTIGFKQKRGFRSDYKKVISNQNLQLYKGETLGLIGPSGSGKSTIGRAIVGLNSAIYNRMDYLGTPGKIQFIFQDPYSALNGSRTVGWILDEVLKKHQPEFSKAQRLEKAMALMAEVGLKEEDLQKKPKAFSGGQRQRIGIARALAANPEVLICDESVSALDVSVQAQVLNVLNGIKKNRGLSMIFISHDPDVVRYMCDRIIYLQPLA